MCSTHILRNFRRIVPIIFSASLQKQQPSFEPTDIMCLCKTPTSKDIRIQDQRSPHKFTLSSHKYPESHEESSSGVCDDSPHVHTMPPPPLKFQRNSARRAAAPGAAEPSPSSADCRIEPLHFRTMSELIEDLLLVTNFE